MSRTITVVTPENITITYALAGFASRFMATLVDLVLQCLLLLAGAALQSLATGGRHGGVSVASIVSAVWMVAFYIMVLAYATFFEMLWGGRTPGKRLFGLRVIRDGGYPITFVASITRNLLRFLDFGIIPWPGAGALALYGLPGLLCVFFSPTYKRIGDYAAGTLVIVEAGATPFGDRSQSGEVSPGVAAFLPLVRNLDRLSQDDYRLMRRFVARRQELELTAQASLGERLARPLLDRLEIPATIHYQIQFADALEAIERRYAEEHGLL